MAQGAADITIVGLGPGDHARRTIAVQEALDSARCIFVRTHKDVDVEDLTSRDIATDLEAFRDSEGDIGSRWNAAVRAVCDAAADGPVVLAIPGHPRFGEGLVDGTVREAARRGLSIRMLDGISVVDLIAGALDVDPLLSGVQCFNARMIANQDPPPPFAGGTFSGSPHRPMLFTHVYDNRAVNEVATVLQRVLPRHHPVTRIERAGMPGERISEHTIGDLPNLAGGPLVALWVPSLDRLDAHRDPRTLQHIVARLRAPDGCPWDRKQTNQSLRDSLVDEVYEAVDAIDADDMGNLAEELGDVFLLIAMHAQIAEEAGHFTLEDVFEGISAKIIRRHPHVFGDRDAHDSEDVIGIWRKVKAEEKANGSGPKREKATDGEPHSMPALERARRVLRKHPLDVASIDQDSPGERLLAAVAGIIDAGEDPDTALRAALERHVRGS